MRRSLLVLLLALVLCPAGVLADEKEAEEKPAKPLTTGQAADAVLKAVKANDVTSLKALAEKDEPDPWIVADELCFRGEHDAAQAFAKAAPRIGVGRLPGYVEAWRPRESDARERELLAAMIAAMQASVPLRVVGETASRDEPLDTVIRIRLGRVRGLALRRLHRLGESENVLRRAAEAAEARGWLRCASSLHSLAGQSAYLGSAWSRALAAWTRHLALARRLGDGTGVAKVLARIGMVHSSLGDYGKALATYERALEQQKALGDEAWAAGTLGNIGIVYWRLGDYAKALATQERALEQMKVLGNEAGVAAVLVNTGIVHCHLGDYAKALTMFEWALERKEALGDEDGAARTLGNIGSVYQALGDYPKALTTYERAHEQMEAVGDRVGAAGVLGSIGSLHADLCDYAKALATYERALEQQEVLGHKVGAAAVLGSIGDAHYHLGNHARALPFLKRALRMARRLRSRPIQVQLGTSLARVHLDAGDPARALMAAQEALRELEDLAGGLGEEEGTGLREEHGGLFEVGTLAAIRLEEAADAVRFIESGRAGALLDSLDKREVLRWKAESLPPDLLAADREARAAQSLARHEYDRAVAASEDLRSIRRAASALDDATASVRAVAARIQRTLKAAAGLFYPRAATLEEIQGWLEKDEALVLYGLCLDEALALVLTQESEQIVPLGTVKDVTAACEALDCEDGDADPSEPLARLKKLLVDPLRLGDHAKTVLVSPEGPLCYVPFGALFKQPVAMTPSGTTHVLLLDEERGKGEGILALGDPDYAGVSEGAHAIYFRGRKLTPLSATRGEVEAVGTERLLGADANEEAFAERVKTKKRWRAVHFACHGLVDPERPTLSSLALSGSKNEDGFLTALEVLRMEIPADLAVLSACETAKGKIVKGEGIVGLTRAFMYAGAPRVICSLWKVDDEATQALMIKFYELWNPNKDGSKGLGAAAALRKAQEFIRNHPDHPKWKHPYYWAAWVLWGIPN